MLPQSMFRYVGSFMAYIFHFMRRKSGVSCYGILNGIRHFRRIVVRPSNHLYPISQLPFFSQQLVHPQAETGQVRRDTRDMESHAFPTEYIPMVHNKRHRL